MTPVEAPPRPPLDSTLYRTIASIGSADEDELRYQLEKRGEKLDALELDRLCEEGHIREERGSYVVVVPERIDRGHMRGPSFDDEDLLDRIRLWALIVGRPPSQIQWGNKNKVIELMSRLTQKLEVHQKALDLYESGDWPTSNTVRERFGSINAALVAAGFDPRPIGRQPADERDAELAEARDRAPRSEQLRRRTIETYAAVTSAREAGDEEGLHRALTSAAVAAFNEADALRRWSPEGGG